MRPAWVLSGRSVEGRSHTSATLHIWWMQRSHASRSKAPLAPAAQPATDLLHALIASEAAAQVRIYELLVRVKEAERGRRYVSCSQPGVIGPPVPATLCLV